MRCSEAVLLWQHAFNKLHYITLCNAIYELHTPLPCRSVQGRSTPHKRLLTRQEEHHHRQVTPVLLYRQHLSCHVLQSFQTTKYMQKTHVQKILATCCPSTASELGCIQQRSPNCRVHSTPGSQKCIRSGSTRKGPQGCKGCCPALIPCDLWLVTGCATMHFTLGLMPL